MDQMINNIQLTWKLIWMLKTFRTYNSTVEFSKYEFYNKLLGDVILLRVTLGVTWTRPYIYIYMCVCMYEMSLSHIWCNSCKVTYFLHRIFLRNLTVKKFSLNAIIFHFFI